MQTISDNSIITDVATNYLHLLNNVNLNFRFYLISKCIIKLFHNF